jgi:hypothetical protein
MQLMRAMAYAANKKQAHAVNKMLVHAASERLEHELPSHAANKKLLLSIRN